MGSVMHRFLSWGLSALPTAAILGLLALLGWYGSSHDWKAPSWAALWNPEGKADAGKKSEEESAEKEKELPGDEKGPLPLVSIPKEAADLAGVRTSPALRRKVSDYVNANGEIDFNQHHYAHLTTRSPGIVWSVEKQQGDRVKQGDLLALIASAELARLKNDFQQAMYQVQQRQRMLERRQRASGAIAQEQVIDASMAVRDAKIRMLNDQQSLENLGLPVRSRELMDLEEETISERLRLLGIAEDVIRREGKKRITSNLLPMRAPFDGEVVQRDMVLGEMVASGPPQFVIANLSKLWLRLYVRQEDQGKVARDQKVYFSPRGANEEAPVGIVRRISAEVDARTRTVPVFAEVDNSSSRLRPNTFGVGRIRIAEHWAVVVPSKAIQWDGHTFVLFVKKSESEYEPRRIKRGEEEEGMREILPAEKDSGFSDVKPGEEVATENSYVLKSALQKADISGED